MFSLFLNLFIAGMLTILLPCILPLVPIVVGASAADRDRRRPLLLAVGMCIGFVGSTFLLQVVLKQFTAAADIIRIGTYEVLFLFGVCFFTSDTRLRIAGAIVAALFFVPNTAFGPTGLTLSDIETIVIAMIFGIGAVLIGGVVATRLQQFGTNMQSAARSELGANSVLSSLIIGLTLGLVWVPCAGPALGYALALVRDKPGLEAFLALSAYGIGAAVPILIVGYGGQAAVQSARNIARYSGVIKKVAGMILLLTAIALRFDLLQSLQVSLADTSIGNIGTTIEEKLFGTSMSSEATASGSDLPVLQNLGPAPALTGLGTWHNSKPLTAEDLKGKVVLIDFWTYSCINCIRTLPYIESYWEKYKDSPFLVIGIHSPEFTFEHDDANVADAIKKHGLTYPIAQDNDFNTWKAFHNQFWPAKYLIDAEGNLRYTHFGEGGYDETDSAIASLLREIGVKKATGLSVSSAATNGNRSQTPETYLNSRNWDAFQNKLGDPDASPHVYTLPKDLSLNTFALGGNWELVNDEHSVLLSDTGDIQLHFTGAQANLVLGMEDGKSPATVSISVDGKPSKTFSVTMHDLYTLFDGDYGEHTVTLHITGAGLGAYAFTFGS